MGKVLAMTRKTFKLGLLACVTAALLSACGNSDEQATSKLAFSTMTSAFMAKPQTQAATLSPEMVGRALAGSTGPLVLIEIEKRKASTLLLQIEENGPYRVFGTAQRQTVTFKDGMITSTRGLGDDLMSSDADALLALVTNQKEGVAPYTMRFLTGEDRTKTIALTCTVSKGEEVPVTAGLINTTATLMKANCANGEGSVQNVFAVGKDGYVLSTRQWLGTLAGYANTQALRL